MRQASPDSVSRIAPILRRLRLKTGRIESHADVSAAGEAALPDECYCLGAQTSVADSLRREAATLEVNLGGTAHILAALRMHAPQCRFFFAASTAMYGNPADMPQNENTPPDPPAPDAISKLTGLHLTRCYRRAHGLHASAGILFNHKSPRRTPGSITRKIAQAAARILIDEQKQLTLGNLEGRRDLGTRARLRGSHVADTPAARAGRLRHRHR